MTSWQRINYSSERVGVVKTMSDMAHRLGPNQMTLDSVSWARNTTDGRRKETIKLATQTPKMGRKREKAQMSSIMILVIFTTVVYNTWHYSSPFSTSSSCVWFFTLKRTQTHVLIIKKSRTQVKSRTRKHSTSHDKRFVLSLQINKKKSSCRKLL